MIYNEVTYDIETYPNIFTLAGRNLVTGEDFIYEISWRMDQRHELIEFLRHLRMNGFSMIGFNNLGFDYPVVHYFIENYQTVTVEQLYQKAMSIINADWNDRFAHVIWEKDQHVPQIDLYKIHHFDNPARATSLKVLEFNMKMDNVEDLPFPAGTMLTSEQMSVLVDYNKHDIEATTLFKMKSETQLSFRRQLCEKYDRDVMNFNDTKIGKDYFIRELEKDNPGICYSNDNGKRRPRQTKRDIIHFNDILLPYIQFNTPDMQAVHNWFRRNSIKNTKGSLDLSCTLRGFEFDFGTGGIHGSVRPCTVLEDVAFMILDIDVTSYYPSLAIVNKFHPAHLGEKFCQIYEEVFNERKKYPKSTHPVENNMLKLALNGVYGDSNNEYSPLFDPQYTMAITINGQLLLCMLAERLMSCQEVLMIQINTDGMTIKFPRTHLDWVRSIMKWWEDLTKLQLEEAEYSRFFVRDVNNYIAEYTDGKLKRKGAYEYEMGWHQNQSSLVIQKAVEAHLVHGKSIREFIEGHDDIYDFLLRTKVPRSSKLVLVDYEGNETQIQNVSRYYISMFGGDLTKVMPPTPTQLAKDKDAPMRRININSGSKVSICNNISDVFPDDIEYEYYIKEANKLANPVVRGGVL